MINPIKDVLDFDSRAHENLTIVNTKFLFQHEEKAKRVAELVIANAEKGERAAELVIANAELLFQNEEKAKRAEELDVAKLQLILLKKEMTEQFLILIGIAENQLRFILENSPTAIRICSKLNGRVLLANKIYCNLTGVPIERVIGIDPRQYYPNPEYFDQILELLSRGEIVKNKLIKVKNEKGIKWVLASFMASEFEGQSAYIGWFYDITEQKCLEDKASHMANFDALTGLPNRGLFMDRLGQVLISKKRSSHSGVLLFIGIGSFKPLSDVNGSDSEGALLIEVGARIKRSVQVMDTVARIGSDEFVVLINELMGDEAESIAQATAIAEKIYCALAEPYQITKPYEDRMRLTTENYCNPCIGVAVFSGRGADANTILNKANLAMCEANNAGCEQIKVNPSII